MTEISPISGPTAASVVLLLIGIIVTVLQLKFLAKRDTVEMI